MNTINKTNPTMYMIEKIWVHVKNKQKLKNGFKLETHQYNTVQHHDKNKESLYALLFV